MFGYQLCQEMVRKPEIEWHSVCIFEQWQVCLGSGGRVRRAQPEVGVGCMGLSLCLNRGACIQGSGS